MKYVISNSQLVTVAHRYLMDQLKEMDFKKLKNKDFEFFPKGNHSATHGIEADWVRDEKGYRVLVGFNLWKSVMDLFNLTMEETREVFIKAFTDLKLTPLIDVDTIDVYDIEKAMGLREDFVRVPADDKLKSVMKKFIMEKFPNVYEVRFHSHGVKLASSPGSPVISETVVMPIIDNSKNEISATEIKALSKEIWTTVNGMFGLNIDEYGSGWQLICKQLAIVGIDTHTTRMR